MINKNHPIIKQIKPLVPWLAGAGFAIGHIAATTSCTLPKEGRCATCGGCVIALGSLVAWAVMKKRTDDDIYSSDDHGAV